MAYGIQEWNSKLVPLYADKESLVYRTGEADKVIEHYKRLAEANVEKIKEELKENEQFQKALKSVADSIISMKAEEPVFYFSWKDKDIDAKTVYEWLKAMETFRHSAREWEEQERGSVCVVERVRDKYLLEKCQELLDMIKN